MKIVRINFYTINFWFDLINTYRMSAFESISKILGKFGPAQRLTALGLVLAAIVGISFFQFVGESKPECETLQAQLIQTQNQLTSTISSQNTFVQTIDDLRKKTFDLNTELSKRDSIIFAISRRANKLEKESMMIASVDNFEVEPMRMMMLPTETEPVLAASLPAPRLNKQNPYEDTIQIISPSPAPDSVAISNPSDTNAVAIDTSVSKSKVSWFRRILGRKD
jgi:hypothetical protein